MWKYVINKFNMVEFESDNFNSYRHMLNEIKETLHLYKPPFDEFEDPVFLPVYYIYKNEELLDTVYCRDINKYVSSNIRKVIKDETDITDDINIHLLKDYPDDVCDVLKEKKELWEYELYIRALLFNFENNMKTREASVHMWRSRYCDIKIENIDELNYYSKNFFWKLERLLGDFSVCLSEQSIEAFGEKGESGDAYKIIRAADDLTFIYKEMLRFRDSFSRIEASWEFRKIIEEFYNVFEDIIEQTDTLYDKLLNARNMINDYYEGLIKDEDLHIDFFIELQFDADDVINTMKEIIK